MKHNILQWRSFLQMRRVPQTLHRKRKSFLHSSMEQLSIHGLAKNLCVSGMLTRRLWCWHTGPFVWIIMRALWSLCFFMFLCVLSVSCTSYFDDVYYAASIPHEPCEIIFPHDSYDSYASNEFWNDKTVLKTYDNRLARMMAHKMASQIRHKRTTLHGSSWMWQLIVGVGCGQRFPVQIPITIREFQREMKRGIHCTCMPYVAD